MTINRTFIFQNELPTLPIPPLESTKSKLIEWIEPLVSEEQLQQTSIVMNRFFENDGEAEKLQLKLKEWAECRDGSWLAPFWEEAYLSHRSPLPYSTNFNILLKNDQLKNCYKTSKIAGKVSCLVAELYHKIIDETVEPDTIRGKRLDMGQYKNFFRSIRIPKLERDTYHIAEFDKKNNHVIILYKNNVYKVQVTNDQGEICQSIDIIEAIEKLIFVDQDEGNNVGIFTTASRDKAAEVYNMLSATNANVEILQAIAESLVIISIDEESKDSQETIRNLMLGENNKYFDKTIQIIITKQNELGFNIEHCAVDGTSISAVISHVSKGLKEEIPRNLRPSAKPIVKKLTWKLDKETQSILKQCQKEHGQQKNNYHLQSTIFTDFGTDEIKKMKCSPDAFFHMALQIAQYRTYGTFKSVYEPVSVRFFYNGRTECARATSIEKRKLVEALEDGIEDNAILYSLMQTASNAHSTRINECQKGLGIERHMYGLEQMFHLFGAELGISELPEIFNDKGYLTMRHDFISTSGMAYDNVKYRMFGPVVKDGHGLAYILLKDTVSINISSYTENKDKATQLMEHMIDALRELRRIGKTVVEAVI